MAVEIRTVTPDELEAWMRSEDPRWGTAPDEELLPVFRDSIEPERSLVAVDRGRFVGSATILTSSLGLPGGRVPAAGVTWVSVHPTHRRRGILRSMMLRQLRDIAEAGVEPVAMLGASESAIYRRFGYGAASFAAEFRIDTARSAFATPHEPQGEVELVDADTFLHVASEVYSRLTEQGEGMPGTIGRPSAYWRAHALDSTSRREGMSPRWYVIHRGAHGPDGYLMYRLKDKWTDELADYTLRVEEMLATPGDAERTLWRYCLDHDLVRRVEGARRPVDEPVVHLLADPRQYISHQYDDVWVRVVDLPGAFGARRYPFEGSLVVEVSDEVCPQVAGRWRIEGGPEGAGCSRTADSADLALDAATLGSLLLGGVPAESLARAGLIEELRPGAAVGASRLFAWHRVPWNLGEF